MSKIISRVVPNYEAKKFAFPYQMQAFLSIKDLNYSAIFHEQGLGKTKIAIDLLLYWLDKKSIDTVFIVTKKQLIQNWLEEIAIHTYLSPKVLTNNRADNFYVLNSPVKLIVTNFETIVTDKERIQLFLKCRDVGIIIDESAKLKNPKAKLAQTFFELADLFKFRTIMTGTPVANRPYDIWAQIYFLDKGESLGQNFEEFKRDTDLKNDLNYSVDKKELFEETISEIYEKISSFSVRETKATCGITLPEKVYQSINAYFEPKQKQMYEEVLTELQLEVQKDSIKYLDDDRIILKRLLRLIQIASNPKLVDETYCNKPGKEEKLDDLLKMIVDKGEKCIVWSNFIENIERFKNVYKRYNPQKLHGSMTIAERNAAVDIFKKDTRCKVLFATPQAAKEGLTLTVANHVIFYDRGFNLDDYLQAQDRIHRISQKKICYVYNIVIPGSIDDWVSNLLDAKQYAAFLTQGDISKEEYKKHIDYSYGDIIKEIINSKE